MKKVFLSFLVSIACVFSTFAQIKDYVCVVHDVFNEKTVSDLEDFRDQLKKEGAKDLANAINNFITGCYGSGFVYVDKDGKNYIVTNRHVVEDAKTLDIDFYNSNGSVTKFENLKVKAISQDLDLALLSFPQDVNPFKKGLDFSTAMIEDGDEVWSAGFPALEGKPAWQFGKGNVTNSAARIESLVDPEVSTLIQHSAQTDSGNSGGPLLVKNGSANSGYYVIGINTWKASSRQDTNFAIPAVAIKKFITETLSGKSSEVNQAERVAKQAANFSKIINNIDAKYEEVVPFISMDYVAESGKQTFFEVYRQTWNTNTWSLISEVFVKESPIEGMRFAIAWKIFNEFHLTKAKSEDLEEASFSSPELLEGTDDYKVVYSLNYKNGTADSVWTNNYGIWQLKSFENTNKRARNKALKQKSAEQIGSVSFLCPYTVAFGAGPVFFTGVDNLKSPAVNVDLDVCHGAFSSFKTSVTFAKTTEEITIFEFDFGYKLQFPFMVYDFTITPYAFAGIGLEFATRNPEPANFESFGADMPTMCFNLCARPGLRVIYTIADTVNVYADAGFNLDVSFFMAEDFKKFPFKGVFLGFGVGF